MRVLTLADIMREPVPPVEWLVAPLIARGERAVVYGESGSLKSWLLLHLALHLAAGRDWLGWPVDRASRVLYVDAEMTERGLRRRVARLAHGAGLADTAPFVTVARSHFRAVSTADSKTLLDAVRQQAAGFDPQVVVVETMRETMVGDENSSRDVVNYFHALAPLVDDGRTLIVSHHMGKPPGDPNDPRNDKKHRLRGSSRIRDHVDVLLAVEKPNDAVEAVVISHEKSREGGKVAPWGVRLDEPDGREQGRAVLVRDDSVLDDVLRDTPPTYQHPH